MIMITCVTGATTGSPLLLLSDPLFANLDSWLAHSLSNRGARSKPPSLDQTLKIYQTAEESDTVELSSSATLTHLTRFPNWLAYSFLLQLGLLEYPLCPAPPHPRGWLAPFCPCCCMGPPGLVGLYTGDVGE